MNREQELKDRRETIEAGVVLILLSILMFLYMGKSGVLNSGYHLIDDHELITIKDQIDNNGFYSALTTRMAFDISYRFRPTYWLVRMIQIALMGTNFTLWHFFYTVLSIITLFTSYLFARRMQCPVLISLLFVYSLIYGQQMAIVWRLGPQENIGLLLLMTTLLFLKRYSKRGEKKYLFVLFCLISLLGGAKESFLVLLPLLPFFLFYFCKQTEEISDQFGVLVFIKKYFVLCLFIFTVFLVAVFILVNVSGVNKISYAGIDTSYTLHDYYLIFKNFYSYALHSYFQSFIIFFVILGVSIIYILIRKTEVVQWKTVIFDSIFFSFVFIYIVFTQMIVHAKSGIFERYYIPITFGFSFLIIIGGYSLYKQLFQIEWMRIIPYLISFLLVIILSKGYNAFNDAKNYALDGYYTAEFMEKIGQYSEIHPSIMININEELNMSTAVYLREYYGISNFYTTDEEKAAQIYVDKLDIPSDFMEMSNIIGENYTKYEYGLYRVWISRELEY